MASVLVADDPNVVCPTPMFPEGSIRIASVSVVLPTGVTEKVILVG